MVQVGGRLLAHYLLALPMPVLVALLGLLADFLLPPFCALTLLAWSINDMIPKSWSRDQSEPCTLVQVQMGSVEWKSVDDQMKKTLPGATIETLERIQNLDLWELYSQRKERMTRLPPRGVVPEEATV